MIGKFIYDENKQRLNIEDALTITKGKWADGNELNEDRVGYFVTSDNENNEIEIATATSYICGVTIKDDTFLYPDLDDPSYCVVQSLGLCTVKDDGSLSPGDKCMPSDKGIAVRSSNNLGYRVVSRVDDNLIKIIVAPNNDMVQRIKGEVVTINATQTISGDKTFAGNAIMKEDSDYTTSRARNISIETEKPTSIPDGCIVGVIE